MDQQTPEIKDTKGWSDVLLHHADNPPVPKKTGELIIVSSGEYRLSKCENRIKAQFEQWVDDCMKKRIKAEKDPLFKEELMEQYLLAHSSGAYSWHDLDGKGTGLVMGAAIFRALKGLAGTYHLLFLLLRRCHPDMTEDRAKTIWSEDPEQCSDAISWALGNDDSPASMTGDKSASERSSNPNGAAH